MAYINQERKAILVPAIKAILKKYGMKGSLRVRNHSTLILTLRSGKLDMLAQGPENDVSGYYTTNSYSLDRNYTGDVLAFLTEVYAAMNNGNHDNSDPQTDYFDVGWYAYVNVGDYDTPYTKTI